MLRPHPDHKPDIPGIVRIGPHSHSQNPDWSGLIWTNLDKTGRNGHKFPIQHAKLSQTDQNSPHRPARPPPTTSERRLLAALTDVEAAEARRLDLDVRPRPRQVEPLPGDGGEVFLVSPLQALDVAAQGPDVVEVLPRPADR